MTEQTQAKTNPATGVISQMKELVELKDSFEKEQLVFIKNLINPDLSDNELYMFLAYANRAGLNPFNKEILAVVYSKNDPSKRRVSIIVARDGKRAVGERKGGIESITTEPIYVKETVTNPETKEKAYTKVEAWEGGKLWGATCTLVRNGKTFKATVPFGEYNTGQNLWISKPETMIKKVAESQALSMAVPELLGTYDESEMPTVTLDGIATPVSEDDNLPATEAQKKTVSVLAAKHEVKADPETMTQSTAKAFIAGMNSKK